jgi:hypothetical protein
MNEISKFFLDRDQNMRRVFTILCGFFFGKIVYALILHGHKDALIWGVWFCFALMITNGVFKTVSGFRVLRKFKNVEEIDDDQIHVFELGKKDFSEGVVCLLAPFVIYWVMPYFVRILMGKI